MCLVTQSLCLRDVHFPEISFAALVQAQKRQQRLNLECSDLATLLLSYSK